mgnify:CR=1 FL=1
MSPQRVDTAPVPRSYAVALRTLAFRQKSAKGAPAYSRFVNRRLGRLLAALAYVAGLTPNQVTAISACFTFTGIGLIALAAPTPPVGLCVALALVVGYAFDSADGQLARLRGGGSTAGEWLDHMVDAVKISSLHLAVLVSWYRFPPVEGAAWLLVPVGFTVVAAVLFFGMILNDQLRRLHHARRGTTPVEPARPSVIRSLLVVPTDYGLLCLAFALLGFAEAFAVLYGLLFAGNLLFLLAAAVKWYRDIASLDA